MPTVVSSNGIMSTGCTCRIGLRVRAGLESRAPQGCITAGHAGCVGVLQDTLREAVDRARCPGNGRAWDKPAAHQMDFGDVVD